MGRNQQRVGRTKRESEEPLGTRCVKQRNIKKAKV